MAPIHCSSSETSTTAMTSQPAAVVIDCQMSDFGGCLSSSSSCDLAAREANFFAEDEHLLALREANEAALSI